MLTNNSQRGFYLIEAIVVMSVAISLMSLGSRYITDSAERSVNQVTAQQLKQVTRSAQQYVQDHYQVFNDNPNHPLEWQTLVNQGYLPDKVSKQNHYGHNYQFEVKNANRQLQLILTTQGGQAIREASLRQIAALAGSSAGYATTLHKNKIVGNQEGWFLEGVPLPTGHLASFTVINEKEIMDAANFLRRTKFKDHKEYNQMETDLLMGENTIQLVKDNNSVELNTDKLSFIDSKGKSIGIFNSYFYPHIAIQDNTLPDGPNDMLLNSADLIFKKENHTIRVGVDEPEILISNGEAMSMKPDRLLIKDKYDDFQTIISSNNIKVVKKVNHPDYNAWGLDPGITRLRSEIDGTGVRVPYYLFKNRDTDFKWLRKRICKYDNGKFNNEDGKIFLMGQRDIGSKLYVCVAGIPRRISSLNQ